ncbi:EAL domain-containing protein [Colwellia sp. D2M02]|nr:EAL domain-containing protein [Colwellia sp. D2M02]MBU2894259.1 EAL domain-containing protein [Colwellia sp. D2M02]
MQMNILTCTADTPIYKAASRMRQKNISSILVIDNGKAIGIWTEADCRKINFNENKTFITEISQLMSTPVLTIQQNLLVHELSAKFRSHAIRHFIVVDNNNSPIGIVSQSDVIKSQGIEHYLQAKKVANSYKKITESLNQQHSLNCVAQHMKNTQRSAALIYHTQRQQYGIVTERDLLTILTGVQYNNDSAWHYANYPLQTVNSNTSLYSAYQHLINNNIRHLAVCNSHDEIIGLLTMDNIMSDIELAYVEELHQIVQQRDVALKKSKQHLLIAEKIIEASLDGIMITNANGSIMSVNPAFTKVTGYQADEVIGKRSNILSSGLHCASFYHELWQTILTEGVWQGEIWNKRKNGEVYPQWLTIIEISESKQKNQTFAAIFSDISDRKMAEKRIENLAFYDELTQLPNRRLFYDRIDIALASAHRNQEKVALFFIDLDYFKDINDNYGHRVGDQLLQSIAKRLTDSIKEGDTVARLGGDEFTLLLTEIKEVSHISKICQRVIDQVRQPYHIDGHTLQVTTSIGIAVYPDDGTNETELLKNADIAMYRAKDIGRNSFQLFTPAMNAQSLERSLMQNHFRLALKNNELILNYQLQKNILNDEIHGVETLLRWSNPTLGQVSPAQFIPMAEELGLIAEVDNWVLAQACQQRKTWLDNGVNCGRIAVNISPLHFHQGDLIASVKSILSISQLPPELLEIEVTESCFIKQLDNAANILQELKKMGIKIALDDFGTGFSSLSYLTRLPIDIIKIDASFIAKLPNNYREAQITSAIIMLAQNLELEIVAEGVENEAQMSFLLEHGCNIIQGYLYSKPAPEQHISSILMLDTI